MRSAALVDVMKMVIMMGKRMYVTVSSAKKNDIEPITVKNERSENQSNYKSSQRS